MNHALAAFVSFGLLFWLEKELVWFVMVGATVIIAAIESEGLKLRELLLRADEAAAARNQANFVQRAQNARALDTAILESQGLRRATEQELQAGKGETVAIE